MDAPDKLCIYPWANAPPKLRRSFGTTRRGWIVYVPKGRVLGPTHFARRLEDIVEKKRRDGSTLIAGNEPGPEEMN